MTDDLLDLDVRLVLLRHGKSKVLQAIARASDQTVADVQNRILEAAQKRRPRRAEPSMLELVAAKSQEYPASAEHLRALALRFENRSFLPQLRDVKRFLERFGVATNKLRSREAAIPILANTLTKLSPDELARLVVSETNDSDYSLLAHAIIGGPATPHARRDD